MYTYSMKVRSCLFIFITLTNGNGGREGGRGQRWNVLLKGGSGGPPPEKKLEFRSSEIDSEAI